MNDPIDVARRELEDATLRGAGKLPPSLRQQIARNDAVGLDGELATLVSKIEREALSVTDDEITALTARYSEDELFEAIVSASLGASIRRLDAGLRALEEA